MPRPETERPSFSAPAPTSRRVARNSILYFSSLAVPALAAIFLVPVTVRALGLARFGLLALAWAVAEGSGMFDFGLGRATVRFVADGTARGADRVREIVLASAFSQTSAGFLAGLVLFLVAPVLVHSVFKISPAIIPEAIAMFRALAFHLPVILCIASLRASLEGAQRFDLSTALRIPSSLASVIVPAVAASLGASLPTIMWILFAVRLSLALLNAEAVRRTLLQGRWRLPSGFKTLREMLGYSGWVAISTALGPALASFDRFVVGSVVGVTGLGYYTGAAEAANRFLLIPATAFSAMLPALSAADAHEGRDRVLVVTRAARRQLEALLFPLCLALFVFAPTILGVWLGPVFAQTAGRALRILSVGVFLTGLAHLPMALLYGSARPDLPAKINLFQVAVHIPLTIFLVREWGITGAAVAWSVRCSEDLILYTWASRRAVGRAPADPAETARARSLWGSGLILAGTFALAFWLRDTSQIGALVLVALGLAQYAWTAWQRVLTRNERRAWAGLLFPARFSSV
jgi:O-antigen/teichoic acid export membrane protein